MTNLRLVVIFLTSTFYACEERSIIETTRDPAVTHLVSKIAPLVNHLANPDSCKKALAFLDSATAMDKNCFLCYFNKIMFLSSLKQIDKAVVAMNNCIRIRPNAHDLYLTGGALYEQVGDTVSSTAYFKKSLMICNSVLDTMNVKNFDYTMYATNRAINLIMLGDSLSASKVLNDLYLALPDDSIYNNVEKKYVQSLMNKNKQLILDYFKDPEKHSR